MTYTTADYVYDKVGVTSAQIPSEQMDRILEQTDAEVDRIISSTCVPKTRVEVYAGDGKNQLVLRRIPLMSVTALNIDDTDLSISNINFKEYGTITLKTGAEKEFFYTNTNLNNVRVKYIWGWLEESAVQESVTVAGTAGAGATMTVADGSVFTANDWVRIVGFDGNEEKAQISSISTNVLTLDLVYDHEVGTTVTKLEVPPLIQQLAGTIAAIMGALSQIGSTYTFATSYQTPDYQVSKGVPYPHFQKVLDASVAERDFCMSQLPRWPAFA